LIDKRRYNNAYYDERYKDLKSVNKATAQIYTILAFKKLMNSNDSLIIRNSFIDFNYARIVLDPKIASDDSLLKAINNYEALIYHGVRLRETIALEAVDSLNLQIVSLTGYILRHEKDSVNTAN
jgi:hypothetical protein